MITSKVGFTLQIVLAYAILGGSTLLASSLGAGSFATLSFIGALPTMFFGLFLLADLYGKRQNPTDALYVAKQRGFTIMLPRSKPQEEPRPPTVSGLMKGQNADTRRVRWLSTSSIGLAMIIAAILVMASAYL